MKDRNFWNEQAMKQHRDEPAMSMSMRMDGQGHYHLVMGATTVRLSPSELMKMQKLIHRAAEMYRDDLK